MPVNQEDTAGERRSSPIEESPQFAPGSTGTQHGGIGLVDLLAQYDTVAYLPESAKTYLETLKTNLKTHYPKLKIEAHRLQQPAGSYAFTCDDKAIVLMFADSISAPIQPPHAPKSQNINIAAQGLGMLNPNLSLLNAIIVREPDFAKTTAMTVYIGSNLMMNTGAQAANPLDISNFITNTVYAVDRNPAAAQQFVAQLYPHAVLPPAQLGLVIYHRKPRNDQGVRDQMIEQDQPVAAVTAFTDFVSQVEPSGAVKFIPTVRITNIVSVIPAPGLMLIAMQLAAEHFCTDRGWMDQFRSFGKRGQAVNLGNLINDNDGKPYQITSNELLEQFVNTYCTTPVLAVDVVEGQARFPALATLQDMNGGGAVLANYITDFFRLGQTRPFPAQPATLYVKPEFVGYYGPGNGEDTRNFGYLEAVARNVPSADVRQLLYWPRGPEDRAKLINDLLGGMVSIHADTVAVLSPNFLNDFSHVLAAANVKFISTQMQSAYVPMLDLAQAALKMNTMQRVTANAGYANNWQNQTGLYRGM